MKKFSVLVKQVLMSTLTAGIFATGFASCSDEIENEANAFNGANTESLQVMNLEQYSYEVPIKVDVQGDWEIDIKFKDPANRFCYALPKKGHGPQMIDLCMLDNWTEERNEGELIIRDLGNSSNDKTFRLMQKCNLDNPEFVAIKTRGAGDEELNDSIIQARLAKMYQMGARTKAVGYGYNFLEAPGAMAVTKNPIIAIRKLKQDGTDAGARLDGTKTHIRMETFSGRSYEEMFCNLSSTTKANITKGALTAEMKATISSTQKSSNSHMFVYTTMDAVITRAYLSGLDRNNYRTYLTDNARDAIDGKGVYATGDKGFKQLIADYGSHLIMQSDLGGHLTYATTIDKSLTESTKEADLYAKCSYENKLKKVDVKSDNSISASIKKTYKNNLDKVFTKVTAIGGNPTLAVAVDTTDSSVQAWYESLVENAAIPVGIGSEKNDLIPLYDLVDDSTPEGKERKASMKAFFENGMAAVMAFDGTGESITDDIYEINLSDFASANGRNAGSTHTGTLVYEAWANNKAVALICKEYIPQISNQGLITTVYPIVNNKPILTDGRFAGCNLHEPARIYWNTDGSPHIYKDGDTRAMETKLYVRGGKVFSYKLMTGSSIKTQIKEQYLIGPRAPESLTMQFGGINCDGDYYSPCLEGLSYIEDYKYPLVKVGGRIWTREDYNGNAPHGPRRGERYGTYIRKGEIFFTNASVENASFPKGWHAGKSTDYKNLEKTVSYDYDIEVGIGGTLEKISGFNIKYKGWYEYDKKVKGGESQYYNYTHHGGGTVCFFVTPDKHRVWIKKDELIIVKKEETVALAIRLCKDL